MSAENRTMEFVGMVPVWERIRRVVSPQLLDDLEFKIGPEMVEDARDHFSEVYNLAEILAQKVSRINKWLHKAEETPKLLFQPSLVDGMAADLL